jgi:hypothetical protein
MDKDRFKILVAAIQNLEETEVNELFKLLHNNKCEYTRNNNGVFINLSWLPEDMICKIEQYVAFCNKSQNEVKHYESLCDVLNKNIHTQKADADLTFTSHDPLSSITDNKGDKKSQTSKVSSSMRFYLLKKKFAKQTPLVTNAKTDLKIEAYVI